MFYRLRDAMGDPSYNYGEIAEIILSDPEISARLLKIVKSPFYGFSQEVETISHVLRDLVFSTIIIGLFKDIRNSISNFGAKLIDLSCLFVVQY